jgi:hypothetical protein
MASKCLVFMKVYKQVEHMNTGDNLIGLFWSGTFRALYSKTLPSYSNNLSIFTGGACGHEGN